MSALRERIALSLAPELRLNSEHIERMRMKLRELENQCANQKRKEIFLRSKLKAMRKRAEAAEKLAGTSKK